MDFLLSTSIDFVIVGFALVMILDFVADLNQLWKDSQSKEVCLSEMMKLRANQTVAFETRTLIDDPWSAVVVSEQPCCCHTAIAATPIQQLLLRSGYVVPNQPDLSAATSHSE